MPNFRLRPSLARWVALISAIASLAVIGAAAQSAGANGPCGLQPAPFAGGSGSPGDPYLISSQAQLEGINSSHTYMPCAFRQTADIALTGAWTPIGEAQLVPDNKNFRGVYDGNGKTISGLNVSGNNLNYSGLFGYTYGPALISNLFVKGSVTANTGGFGLGVVGMADSGTVISNVHADVDVTATAGSIVGGLVGWGPEVTIEESSAAGDVIGASSVGGLIGQPYGRTFGAAPFRATITDSYATGNVTGSATGTGIGGLVGSLNGNDNRVIRSYATGLVTGGTSGGGTSGGLIGPPSGGGNYTGLTVTNSFWDSESTGKSTSANALGTPKTTAQMKSFSTFSGASWDITNGWSASTVWGICNGSTYPFLSGQYSSSSAPCLPPPTPNRLTVFKSSPDNAQGTVTSSPSGIDCGTACSAEFAANSLVTLTATPQQGARFTGWSGACSNQTGPCFVQMGRARQVTATFEQPLPSYALSVTRQGTGTGRVVSSSSGIDCGSTCEASYEAGTEVILVASAAQGSTFTGWTGACSGTGPCEVTMSQARQVGATFTAPAPPFSDVSITLNTNAPARVPPSRVVEAVRVRCEGDAPCRIDSASATAKARKGKRRNAPVSFQKADFAAGTSRVVEVEIPTSVYNKLRQGRKSGSLTVEVEAQGTEGPRQKTLKVGLFR